MSKRSLLSTPRDLLERGSNRPDKIPRYLWGLLVPSSRWGPEWRKRDGIVHFEPGGYATSPRNRPEFAANLYYEVTGLEQVLSTHLESSPSSALEVGCGYGRLSPRIAAHAEEFCGVDPDRSALETAAECYPDLTFVPGRAESLPVPDDEFEL